MKKTLLLLLFTCSLLTSRAQKQRRDSLRQVLQTQKADTNRVRSLLAIGNTYDVSKPDSSVQFAIEALGLSKKLGFGRGVGRSYMSMAISYRSMGNYAKALGFALEGLKSHEKENDTAYIASAYNGIGTIYRDQGNYREALVNLLKGISFNNMLKGDYWRNESALSINTGETYLRLNKLDSARMYTQHALDIAYQKELQRNNPRSMGWFLQVMGNVHLAAGEYPLALEYFRMSFPYSLRMDDYLNTCKVYRGMAQTFEITGNKDSALYYARKSVLFAQEKRLLDEVRKSSTVLSSLFKNIANTDSALFYMELAKTANDSLFSQQNLSEIQSLSFDEKLRQIEREEGEKQAKEERQNNLQYAAIALVVVTFVIFFILFSHSVVANQRLIRFLGILALLIVFEFFNLFLHPYIGHLTHHSPVMMLGIMVCLAALLIPLHHKLEHWITHKLIEKNNKIRLAAAKKTIAKLEAKLSEAPVENSTNAQQGL
jgi:tetratricopeptide (TPR) repeat protein